MRYSEFGEGRPDLLNLLGQFRLVESDRRVWNQPDRVQRLRIVGTSRDDMPMNVRDLVAQELVIDLSGRKHFGQRFVYDIHFRQELDAFRKSQVKQLCGVTLEHDNGPTGKELIVMKESLRQSQVRDEVVRTRPFPRAGLAEGVGHGWVAFRHSSSVITPFLRRSCSNLSVRSWPCGCGAADWPDAVDCFGSGGGRLAP